MSQVKELNKENFTAEVLNSELPVLVDFWAPWCSPCLMMAPILEEVAEELKGKVKIAKLNTEEGGNQDLAVEYQIQSIPNMKFFSQGKIIGEFIGLRDQGTLVKELEELLKK